MDNPTPSTYMEMFYSPVVEPSKVDEQVNLKEFDEPIINLANFNE